MKGAYYTLEAAISAFLIIVIFSFLFLTNPENPELSRANVKNDIYKGLDTLTARGSLRADALNNNATAIQNDLDDFIPSYVYVNVTIFNKTFQNLTSTFDEKTSDTIVVSYLVSGSAGNYTPREVRTYVWGFD